MTQLKSITLSSNDHAILRARLSKLLAGNPKNKANWSQLNDELERASLLPSELVPGNIVRVGSTFTVRDLDSGEDDTFTLAWPENADVDLGRLSVLAPLGTAVIGYSDGDEIDWNMPGGRRRLLLKDVKPPAA